MGRNVRVEELREEVTNALRLEVKNVRVAKVGYSPIKRKLYVKLVLDRPVKFSAVSEIAGVLSKYGAVEIYAPHSRALRLEVSV